MFRVIQKTNLWLLGLLFPLVAQAQQTIADYNLFDNGGIVSSSIADNATLKYLTDKDENTDFVIAGFTGNPTVTYESAVPVVIKAYSLLSSADATADPKSFRLEASNDGSTWTVLSSIFGATFPARHTAVVSTTNRSDAYKFVRLVVRGISGGADLKISELQLFGYPSPMLEDITSSGKGTLTGEYQGETSSPLSNILTDDLSQVFRKNNAKSFWVDYELDTPKRLTGYSLTTGKTSNTKDQVRSWEVLGSNDKENWDILDMRSNKTPFQADNYMQIYEIASNNKSFDWDGYADIAQTSMIDLFWTKYGNGNYLTHSYHVNTDSINKGYNYWWMAHVLDVFVDGYARTGDTAYRTKMNDIYNAQLSYGRGSLKNGFFDDMEWMALACLRAYEVNKVPRWKDSAIQLWDWIKLGWNDHHGGGIQWVDVQPTSKNACSNAPAIIIAARLYNLTGEQEYLDWAEKIFVWMNANLIFEDSGLVKDGYGNEQLSWALTYNQGTWIGACLEMYKITKDQKYYDIAMRTADYVVDDRTKFSPYGVLYNNEGGGDGGLFKGIFMRYLSQWILSGELDEKRQTRFISYFMENGRSLWESATLKPKMLFKNTWNSRMKDIEMTDTKKNGYHASIHISGVMLFELLDELDKKGLLPANNLAPGAIVNGEKEYKYFRLFATSNNDGNNIELAKWQLFDSALNSIETEKEGNNNLVHIDAYKDGITITKKIPTDLGYIIYSAQGQIIASGWLVDEQTSMQLHSGLFIVAVSNQVSAYTQKVLIY